MSSIETIILDNISRNNEEAFFVFNVEDIIKKHNRWKLHLPRITPYYAVKCNNLPLLLHTLAGLNLSFDCSSQAEVESILSCGVCPTNIIFANACKSRAFIQYVKRVGIDLMTFDNEEEIIKIASIFPESRLLLRIKADDSHSTSKLGLKFGAEVHNFEYLLRKAKSLALNVVGIAFHVGSGCQSTHPYIDAIKKARIAFDVALSVGFQFNILDIGGGFPGSHDSLLPFEDIAVVLNRELQIHFPPNGCDLIIIAEPGRYYAMSAFTLVTNITSKRVDMIDGNKTIMYYINDGLYGSFGSVATGNKIVKPIPLNSFINGEQTNGNRYSSVIWGPTCDSWDCIRRDFQMSEASVGQWLVFTDMGSYSISPASNFNGMPLPKLRVFVSDYAKHILNHMQNWSRIDSLLKIE